jgi:hypothetical protein
VGSIIKSFESISMTQLKELHENSVKASVGQAPVAVILAIWEAEIGRIVFWGHPEQMVGEIPISKITRAKWRYGSSCRAPAL